MKVRKFIWQTFEDDINDALKYNANVLTSLVNIGVDYIFLETRVYPCSASEGVQFYDGRGLIYLLEEDYETYVKSGAERFEVINPEYPDRINVVLYEDFFSDIEVRQFIKGRDFFLIDDGKPFEPTLGMIPLSVIEEKGIECFETVDGEILEHFKYVRLNKNGEFYDTHTGKVLKPLF